MHDYEYAVTQHRIGCRLAKRVMFPDSVPLERLRRFGVSAEKHFPYPGLKEEYYLYDFEPDPRRCDAARRRRRAGRGDRPAAARRLALPPQVEPALPQGARPARPRRGRARGRPAAHRRRSASSSSSLAPALGDRPRPGAVEAQSLVALADLVVSAGGTMNREAAALGTPVYTTYGGRLGGVDEALIRSGRLRPLTDPRAVELEKRSARGDAGPPRPGTLVETILGTVGAAPSRDEPHPVTPPERAPEPDPARPRRTRRARGRRRPAPGRPAAAGARHPDLRLGPARPLAAPGC